MKEYHILSLSGGKDSTALAFFMKENMPEIFENTELVFCDTECELPETYDYLNKIEVFLGKKITRIKVISKLCMMLRNNRRTKMKETNLTQLVHRRTIQNKIIGNYEKYRF